ncbi:MAG: LuxR family transcriptional regulator [Treponema sp.]|nr:LuxR family transcriptional regulator [Treponema sp.]
MKAKTAQGGITANAPVLTAREQEVFDLLLTGVIPKEIASSLNISYATVLDHQKNLYRKLEVHNINELLVKYSTERSPAHGAPQSGRRETPPDGTGAVKAVVKRWDTIADELGSYVNQMSKIEFIQGNYFETHTISGNISCKSYAYAGVLAFPNSSTLEAMRKAKRFSFTVLGDGNTYEVKITTTEVRENADHNYYGKEFVTENGVISTFSFNIDELAPSPYFGKQVPFINSNIEAFLFQTSSPGDFNLKFWDINFY